LPNGGIYVEFMAPDLRLGLIVILLGVLGGMALVGKRRAETASAPDATYFVLFFVVAAFVVWLYTSGNGRYFLAGLLMVGPLFTGLVHKLPVSRTLRSILVLLAIAFQAAVLAQVTPWKWWGLAPWGAQGTFYPVTLDERARTETPTYVLMTPNSHSIITYKFPSDARWVNLISVPANTDAPAVRRVRKILSEASALNLVLHTPPPELMTVDGRPTPELAEVIDRMLAAHALALADPSACRLLPSAGFASQVAKDRNLTDLELRNSIGFWICPLRTGQPAAENRPPEPPVEVVDAFAAVEARCPRFFPPGQAGAVRLPSGWMRVYPGTDLRLYIYDEGSIFYRYWRTLNPGKVGTVSDAINDPVRLQCDRIEGRTGFPGAR